MIRRTIPLAALLVASLALAGASRAAVYQLTFTGHVTALSDPAGIFGNVVDPALRIVERIDDDVPLADIRHFISGYGSEYGVYNAGVSATLSLNGVDYTFGNATGALNRVNFLRPGFPSYDGVFTNLSGSTAGATTFLSASATSTVTDFLQQSPFGDFYGSPLDFTTGPSATPSDGSFRIDFVQGNPVAGSFAVDRIVVAPIGSVPEPAAWSLMIAGFGLVGAMARRRRIAVSA